MGCVDSPLPPGRREAVTGRETSNCRDARLGCFKRIVRFSGRCGPALFDLAGREPDRCFLDLDDMLPRRLLFAMRLRLQPLDYRSDEAPTRVDEIASGHSQAHAEGSICLPTSNAAKLQLPRCPGERVARQDIHDNEAYFADVHFVVNRHWVKFCCSDQRAG